MPFSLKTDLITIVNKRSFIGSFNVFLVKIVIVYLLIDYLV